MKRLKCTLIFLAILTVGFSSIDDFVLESSNGQKQQNVIVVHSDKEIRIIPSDNGEVKIHQLDLNDTRSISSSSEDHPDHSFEEEDPGDSDVSEERNPEDLINSELNPVKLESEQKRPDDVISVINSAFNNRKTFSCPKIKPHFVTGTSTANLSPEDIGLIAAMGDSLSTGVGLWPHTDIEFRGAAFPIGGDATIDGLVTVPNILREFVNGGDRNLHGGSHGMGLRDQLPEHQLNVAMSGANSSSMPEQARELVRRLRDLKEVDVYNTWTLVIVTIGTEEVCRKCEGPNTEALIEALDILNRGIHKGLVILLGPIHVSSSYHQKANLLKDRCECSREKSEEFMVHLSDQWTKGFEKIQEHVESVKRKTFNVLALAMLTVTSRYPYSLFIPRKPLLNRRGHTYAAKWLWNRLIAGPKYNLSKAVLSQDAYFCPSLGCPYFRTTDNFNYCKIQSYDDAKLAEEREAAESGDGIRIYRTRYNLYITSVVIVSIALTSVLTLGTVFYQLSKKGTKGRFEQPYGETVGVASPVHGKRSTTRGRAPASTKHSSSLTESDSQSNVPLNLAILPS